MEIKDKYYERPTKFTSRMVCHATKYGTNFEQIRKNGDVCPHCGETNIDGHLIKVVGHELYPIRNMIEPYYGLLWGVSYPIPGIFVSLDDYKHIPDEMFCTQEERLEHMKNIRENKKREPFLLYSFLSFFLCYWA